MSGLVVLRAALMVVAAVILTMFVGTCLSERFDRWVTKRVGWLWLAAAGTALTLVDLIVRFTVGWP